MAGARMGGTLFVPSGIGRPHRVARIVLPLAVVAVAVPLLSGLRPEVQTYVGMATVIMGLGTVWARNASEREPSVSWRFLVVALSLHVVGALVRYAVIFIFYGGVSDSRGYFNAGRMMAPAFRSLQIPPVPIAGTKFMSWLSGLILAVIGNSLIGAFLVCATLAFVGAWFFFKAFCLSFPNGDKRLYGLLIFLVPTMWYWPADLGKDSMIVCFLGIGTYGFALLLDGQYVRGVAAAVAGATLATMIRPPIGAALVIAAGLAFILRPARARSPQMQIVIWALIAPMLAGLIAFSISNTSSYVKDQSFWTVYQANQTYYAAKATLGSNFIPPSLASPVGLPLAILSADFRPFPWEAGGVLPALAGFEGMFLFGFLVFRRREILRGLRLWRRSGMTVVAFGSWIGMTLILNSLGNFGLLSRQRAQMYPFLLMLPALVRKVDKGRT